MSRAAWEIPMLASGCCRSARLMGLGSEMRGDEARSDCGDEVGEWEGQIGIAVACRVGLPERCI